VPREALFQIWEPPICAPVQVIVKRTLKLFRARHPQAETPLRAWHATISRSNWSGPADVKAEFGATVDFVADNRLIFDIAGNKYRVIVHVAYAYKRVLIKFVGTPAEYDRTNPETV
jgi:mRNA interferase HigB